MWAQGLIWALLVVVDPSQAALRHHRWNGWVSGQDRSTHVEYMWQDRLYRSTQVRSTGWVIRQDGFRGISEQDQSGGSMTNHEAIATAQ